MKKSMLCAGLMAILSATVHAKEHNKSMDVTNKTVSHSANKQLVSSDSVPTPLPQGIQSPTDKGMQTPSTVNQAPDTTEPTPTAVTPTTLPTTGTAAPASAITTPSTGTGTPISGTANTDTNTDKGTTVPASGTPSTDTTVPSPGASTSPGVTLPATATTGTTATTSTITTTGATPPSLTTTPAAVPTPPQPLNCNYRIPAETAHIEQTIVMKWAEKAAEQSFDFDHNTIDNQLASLKSCYTEQGWQGFNDALQKSGNLNAIRSQKLMVSSMVNGESKVIEIKDNQWKVIVPMQVVYQNDKEKLTQPLTVNLVVGRKMSGDLGILQMIAIPTQPSSSNHTPQP